MELLYRRIFGGFIAFFVAVVLGPLLMFTPRMSATRRKGRANYGLFSQRYVESFDQKWVRGVPPAPAEELLGLSDMQFLADLGNHEIVREMHVPFGQQDVSRLAFATAAPLFALLLTIFPSEELIIRVFNIIL